jgi:MFS family permease
VLIVVDVLRAVILMVIPLGAWFGFLQMPLLYGLSFILGALSIVFSVAYRSYLPALIRREELVEGNSKLEMSSSFTYIAGPGLAGWLVDVFSAPGAIMLDALSFLLSAFSLGWIRQIEPAPQPDVEHQPIGSRSPAVCG